MFVQVVVWAVSITLAITVLGVLYQRFGIRRDVRQYPPPGRLVDVGTHRMHILESGRGGPTVVLEAGLMSTVLSWSHLQRNLAKNYRVVSYDRAGLGWSELGPMPRTADRIIEELHTLLERAGIPPPYILVGHSFGGLTMPLFAARFPEETAGMVLVDPVAPAEWNPPSKRDQRLARTGAKICRRAALLSPFGLTRFVAFLLTTPAKRIAARLVRLISRGSPANASTISSPWFSALPADERAMAAIFWVQQRFSLTIASQLENLPQSAALVSRIETVCDKPVVVLSAHTASERRRREHAMIAARLRQGTHVLAEESNHWIMQDQPELVIRAVAKVARAAQLSRTTAAARSYDLHRVTHRESV